MSVKQIEAFSDAVQANPALQAEVRQLGDDRDGLVTLGRREGFSFSAGELEAYIDSYEPDGGRELSDEELNAVVGAGYMPDWGSQGCGGNK
jgi:predicted ribosomally synthesized peptide with nif11-like leader